MVDAPAPDRAHTPRSTAHAAVGRAGVGMAVAAAAALVGWVAVGTDGPDARLVWNRLVGPGPLGPWAYPSPATFRGF